MPIITGQTTVTTSSALVAPANSRISLTLTNNSTTPVYYGPSGVSITDGDLLPGVIGAAVTLNTSSAIYGVTASGSAVLSWTELT